MAAPQTAHPGGHSLSKFGRLCRYARNWFHLRGSAYERIQQVHLINRFLTDPALDRYNLSLAGRWDLYKRLERCHRDIKSASDVWQGLLYAAEILRVPPEVPGAVIECGCFKGASTACLSITCKLAGRELIVCDSFAGLPPPRDADKIHQSALKEDKSRFKPSAGSNGSIGSGGKEKVREYLQGEFAGGLEEVQSNVARCGEPSVVKWVPGFFEHSLPPLAASTDYRFIFSLIDVDLFQSTKECLLYIWPRLQEGCKLYTDDGGELDIAAMFFEREWWNRQFGENPPGLFGAGIGLNFFQGRYSAVGMAIKGHHLLSEQMMSILDEEKAHGTV